MACRYTALGLQAGLVLEGRRAYEGGGCMELVWSLHGALEACMETGIMEGASSTSQQNHALAQKSGARATKHRWRSGDLNPNITAWRQKKHRRHLGKGCTGKS